jgi:hypothetical protein
MALLNINPDVSKCTDFTAITGSDGYRRRIALDVVCSVLLLLFTNSQFWSEFRLHSIQLLLRLLRPSSPIVGLLIALEATIMYLSVACFDLRGLRLRFQSTSNLFQILAQVLVLGAVVRLVPRLSRTSFEWAFEASDVSRVC